MSSGPMRILDTHLHLVYQDKFTYPWLTGAPALNRQWSVESYFAEAEKLGIDRALHMEVDVVETDIEGETRFVTSVHPKVVGAIAGCRPEQEDFPRQLEVLGAIKGVRAFRRILHQAPDALSQTPLFAENLRRVGAAGFGFDFCLRADQLPLGMALAKQAPDTQFVIDHCGVPKVEEQELDPWRARMTEFAKLPNVAAKISGVVAYAGPNWTAETLRPFVEHVIETFGWDRVVWGSDHPVCTLTANLTRWVEATRTIVAGASAAEQEKLLSRNAERIYRI